jgi:hypothetical protein
MRDGGSLQVPLEPKPPATPNFPPSRDKPTGGGTRLPQNSGIVLTAPPFLLKTKSESILCTIDGSNVQLPGAVRTTLYELEGI